ncbi:polysaccharide deacetylase family protein [Martelella soudanensis]|uniref:polysaccharide deacetylase family protein n=1 Tax=unclassified Martelella TaxID=2629616 RepID=UPI0015DEE621|nr:MULTISPECIES: polysaccharide deacetylase family protein [unclassified Martelella]
MRSFVTGLAGLCVLALASCASTGDRDTAILKTALLPAPARVISDGPDAIEVITTGSIGEIVQIEDAPLQLGSIHSRIVDGADRGAQVMSISLGEDGKPEYHPLAGRTIYLDETRDITLAPLEVVLTFDDGPVPGRTNAVLDALDAYGVKGLFFMVGEMAHYYPETAALVAKAGQTIATHTWSHPYLPALGFDAALANIDRGAAIVAEATGKTPHFFRFPYLAENERLDRALQNRGLIPVGADVDSRDYIEATTEQLVERVMSGLEDRGGGIVLMHDLQGRTARAIGPLLARLQAGGYKVVQLKYGVPPQKADTLVARLDTNPLK